MFWIIELGFHSRIPICDAVGVTGGETGSSLLHPIANTKSRSARVAFIVFIVVFIVRKFEIVAKMLCQSSLPYPKFKNKDIR